MSIIWDRFTHTDYTKRRFFDMMNEKSGVNTCIGCNVTECKYNNKQYCSLDKIHVGNTCSCDAESCTCCESFQRK